MSTDAWSLETSRIFRRNFAPQLLFAALPVYDPQTQEDERYMYDIHLLPMQATNVIPL
jgi:hypothetical protein